MSVKGPKEELAALCELFQKAAKEQGLEDSPKCPSQGPCPASAQSAEEDTARSAAGRGGQGEMEAGVGGKGRRKRVWGGQGEAEAGMGGKGRRKQLQGCGGARGGGSGGEDRRGAEGKAWVPSTPPSPGSATAALPGSSCSDASSGPVERVPVPHPRLTPHGLARHRTPEKGVGAGFEPGSVRLQGAALFTAVLKWRLRHRTPASPNASALISW